MSLKENIQFFPPFDPDDYLNILKEEYAVIDHPKQGNCYLIDGLPFYKPKQIEDHISVLGFNHAPLSDLLIRVLTGHPEFVPDEVRVLWTIEQELILEATMGEIRGKW